MLFVLAWLLWLYHRNNDVKDGREATEDRRIGADDPFQKDEEAYNKRGEYFSSI